MAFRSGAGALSRRVVGRWIARRCLLAGIGVAIAVVFTQAMVLVLGGLPAWSFAS